MTIIKNYITVLSCVEFGWAANCNCNLQLLTHFDQKVFHRKPFERVAGPSPGLGVRQVIQISSDLGMTRKRVRLQ